CLLPHPPVSRPIGRLSRARRLTRGGSAARCSHTGALHANLTHQHPAPATNPPTTRAGALRRPRTFCFRSVTDASTACGYDREGVPWVADRIFPLGGARGVTYRYAASDRDSDEQGFDVCCRPLTLLDAVA